MEFGYVIDNVTDSQLGGNIDILSLTLTNPYEL